MNQFLLLTLYNIRQEKVTSVKIDFFTYSKWMKIICFILRHYLGPKIWNNTCIFGNNFTVIEIRWRTDNSMSSGRNIRHAVAYISQYWLKIMHLLKNLHIKTVSYANIIITLLYWYVEYKIICLLFYLVCLLWTYYPSRWNWQSETSKELNHLWDQISMRILTRNSA